MEAEPAADDHHAVITQRSDQFADLDMRGGVVVRPERELQHWHLRIRIHRVHQGEGAVVETPLRIKARRHTATLKHGADGVRQSRSAGRVVANVIRVLRKAGIVVLHGRMRGRREQEAVCLPVPGDHQYRPRRLAEFTPHFVERCLKLVIHGAAFGLHPWPGSAPM